MFLINTYSFIIQFLACQRKLQSKDEAIRILRGELELCQEEKSDCIQQMNQIVCDETYSN